MDPRNDRFVCCSTSDMVCALCLFLCRSTQLSSTFIQPPKMDAYCSWCLSHTHHELLKENWVSRNLHRCECGKETVKCMKCTKGMARSPDMMCYSCDGTIPSWDIADVDSSLVNQVVDEQDDEVVVVDFVVQDASSSSSSSSSSHKKNEVLAKYVTVEGRCSWCFKCTDHSLEDKNMVRRNIYNCGNCHNRTVICRSLNCSCLARDHGSYSDELCAYHDGTIKSWEEGEKNADDLLAIQRWCSWCFEFGKHSRTRTNLIRRHLYCCTTCGSRTLECNNCVSGATRGAFEWDDEMCSVCSEEVTNWQSTKDIKDGIIANYLAQTEAFQSFELTKKSKYRDYAMQEGVIRPFLYLVSMTPEERWKSAQTLGFTMLVSSNLGDVHAEAWEIINKNGKGLQARTNKAYETLNPLTKNAAYYDILYRTADAIFKSTGEFSSISSAKESRMISNEIWGAMDGSDAMKLPVIDKDNVEDDQTFTEVPKITRFEEFVIEQLAILQRRTMDESQLEKLDDFLDHDEGALFLKAKLKEAGFGTSKVALSYSITAVYTAVQAGVLPATLPIVAQLISVINFGTSVTASTATALQVQFASGFLISLGIIGWVWTAIDLLSMAFGSTPGQLLPVVVQMMNQKIFMLVQGMQVDDFIITEIDYDEDDVEDVVLE
eukprot:TRINITY_DN4_c0_g1_i12.p1 TRINITY_DN4_c0_g1~~TRINITY_DN4_c0_g1_i12.p1  ORF type:complete len:660 (+),score=170.60 TRINITY_DN4_c0_g1_i12:2099-4078(+)